jgi:hypothetical protein
MLPAVARPVEAGDEFSEPKRAETNSLAQVHSQVWYSLIRRWVAL